MEKAYLVLATGQVFEGQSFGAVGETVGELVFTTNVVGYVESLTDPSYYGQIVTFTFPQMGNYGIISADMESEKCHVRGVVVRDHCLTPSNFRSEGTLDAFLKKDGIVGICGVDTRELTQIIRDHGVVNAKITNVRPETVPEEVTAFQIRQAVAHESTPTSYVVPAAREKKFDVALIDYGAKDNIIRELANRGCEVTVYPYNTKAEDILVTNPSGIMLSNGPGDPSECTACIEEIRKLLGKLPLFGICLGHQLMALAAGAKTVKLKFGHRGANQPVRELKTGRVYITSQNHGYAVDGDTLPDFARLSYVNANDGTCEGVDYPEHRAFSMQFHPEACAGPLDMEFAFDHFTDMMEGK